MIHTYGDEGSDDDVDIDEEDVLRITENAIAEGTAPSLRVPVVQTDLPEGATLDIGGRKCKHCGSTTHSRKSHKDCPHNPKRQKTTETT